MRFVNIGTSNHSDILVVGGGVIGLACAYYLARSGRSVRIIEQETMGAGASHGNCGLIFRQRPAAPVRPRRHRP
jgi:D-amino-acid dehydrogenase